MEKDDPDQLLYPVRNLSLNGANKGVNAPCEPSR